MDYDLYLRLRGIGLTASEAYDENKRREEEIEACKGMSTADTILTLALPVALGVMAAVSIMKSFIDNVRYEKLWITSPSGKITMSFYLYEALRIVRRRKWRLAVVEPVGLSCKEVQ